jgi:iron-sulfur cluster assembly protein
LETVMSRFQVMTMTDAAAARVREIVSSRDGAHVWIAPAAVLFLLGTEMDFEVTKLRTGFAFRNPNQSSACGCGESVELKPADLKALADARAADAA